MAFWQVLQILAAILMVLMPFIMQAKESLHPPMNTPSLGTFGIVMMAAFYFVVAGLVNGIMVGSGLTWPWYAATGLGIAAAALGAVASYMLLYPMALKGGKARTIVGGIGLMVLVAVNVMAPRFV